MAAEQFRFDDGAVYERHHGRWSRLAGDIFLDWLAPKPGLHWIDIGCGSGAFSERIVERYAPAAVQGIDPSEGQLAFARTRPAARLAQFRARRRDGAAVRRCQLRRRRDGAGDLLRARSREGAFRNGACAPPGRHNGGLAWDMFGGGFPLEPIFAELRALNMAAPKAPSEDASRMENLRTLWSAAGATDIETRVIKVHRTFAGFDEFWSIAMTSSVGTIVGRMSATDIEGLKSRVRERLPAERGPRHGAA